MKNIMTKVACGAVIALAFAPLASFAAVGIPAGGGVPQPNNITIDSVTDLIATIANWAFAIFLAVAVIYILFAAYLYLKGEEGDIEKAKERLIAAAIAIAIALLAKGVAPLVKSLLGTSGVIINQ